MSAELRHEDRLHIQNFSDAMLAAVVEDERRYVVLISLYEHAMDWLKANDRQTIPISSFLRLVKATGYKVTLNPKRVHSLTHR
ncbi:hypothetical protein [Streptomyces gobiensis]|uniref:hypothetical protein n=1 Tax=Streptomyces gobiensis TaxID=2875706 RepID=UPI001E43C080|nr:hypothetical protein [Streptomyces gobiensis]UGY94049.1 hypothetical protein test1122_21585 [Streptomyces gobiensis]